MSNFLKRILTLQIYEKKSTVQSVNKLMNTYGIDFFRLQNYEKNFYFNMNFVF